MIGETNPIEATAKKGEVGIIGYVGDDTQCVVTIPMTLGETSLDYVINFTQKPDFTLTYIDRDLTRLCHQLHTEARLHADLHRHRQADGTW